MAKDNLGVSANLIHFPGAPPFEVSDHEAREQQEVARQCRLIRKADRGTAMALMLGLLQVMDPDQRLRLELALSAWPDDDEIEQALALVRFANAAPGRKRLVADVMARSAGKAVL